MAIRGAVLANLTEEAIAYAAIAQGFADRRVVATTPDTAIAISGFHPEKPTIAAQLPGCQAVGVLFGLDGDAPTPLSFRADTLHVHDPGGVLGRVRSVARAATQ